ncbi:sir2 family protein [Mycobacterium xenopi 3993]|nr:sir2 family protein [Mycobacterium xenopi 3993]
MQIADVAVPQLVALLAGRRVVVLTGAGISTDSGIPDYRGPDSPPSNPMTIRQFTSDPVFRQRYWARNHVGWRHMDTTVPNAGHRALAHLERCGVVSGIITQNVDLLHTKAGSRTVVNLHGSYAQVACLNCDYMTSRAALAEQLEALNPDSWNDPKPWAGWLSLRTPMPPSATPPRSATWTARAVAACSNPTLSISARMFPKTVSPRRTHWSIVLMRCWWRDRR